MLNMCLCADLVLTIQSPFTPAASRAKFYYAISTFIPLLMVIVIILVNDHNPEKCISCLNGYNNGAFKIGTIITGSGNLVLAFALSVYILIAIYSFVFAYRRLERPGVSKEVRQMFLKKHLYYVIVFISIWTIQLSSNYFTLFNPASSPYSTNPLNFMNAVIN